MTYTSPRYTNWTAGELSDRLDGRTDLTRYFNGAKSLENFLVYPAGGAARRPGTKFIHEVKVSANAARLIPFEFNTTTANTYVLEFGNNYFRVYQDGGIVTETGKTISGATKANPVVITATSHGFSDGDHVIIGSVAGMVELNGVTGIVANKTTNTFELTDVDGTNINSSAFTTYTSGGTASKIVEVTTTYTTAQLPELKFTQSADVMYITHSSHPVRKISRTSNTDWTITDVTFINGPYLDENATTTTLTPNGRSGSITLTASSSTFVSTDVGRLVKIYNGYAKITAFTSATVVAATVQTDELGVAEILPTYASNTISFVEGDPSGTGSSHNDFIRDSNKQFVEEGFTEGMIITASGASNSGNNKDYEIVKVTSDEITLVPVDDVVAESASNTITLVGKLNATDEFSLGAFSETTGFPRACAFYEQRLVFAGTTNQPQALFFSVAGDFENMTESDTDSSAMNYTIGSNQVNRILYLASARSMVVGTTGGEFVVRASGTDEPITPTNIQIKQQATYGSADVQPVQAGSYTLFVQRAKRKLRELGYVYDTDAYQAVDLTILADHVTENGLVELAYQQEPFSLVWATTGDGRLIGMTYRREEQVVAWHQHKLGGSFTTGGVTTNHGVVENIAVIPGELNQDNLYMVVKRTINGATRRYVEILSDIDFGTDIQDAIFVDSSLTYSGSSTSSLSGLDHLEGQTVSILEEGAAHPDKTVSSGSIATDRATTKAQVGLGYTSTLRTVRLESGSASGTAQGKIKKIHSVIVRFFRTVGASVGTSTENTDTIPFRDSSDPTDTAVPLFTGDKTIEAQPSWDTEGSIVVKQTQPLPMTIVGIYPRVVVQDFD
jgi:hypothetical protein|tara:strand:- start:2164 stop:4692 length:2529 start_codon:yes stop_codon:yes gene_type:complete